jgi:hypothetical protein
MKTPTSVEEIRGLEPLWEFLQLLSDSFSRIILLCGIVYTYLSTSGTEGIKSIASPIGTEGNSTNPLPVQAECSRLRLKSFPEDQILSRIIVSRL